MVQYRYIEGSQVIISPKTLFVILSLKITFVVANSADPDEMPHYIAFHQGLHCLPKYPRLGVSGLIRVKVSFPVSLIYFVLSNKY